MASIPGRRRPPEPPDGLALVTPPETTDQTALADTPTCPVCQREDALVTIGETTFCAACGYSSAGSRGCT